jgi:hypothetical protein
VASADVVADVGRTIVATLVTGLTGIVAPANILVSTPDDMKTFTPTQPSVTIFLFHVSVNAEMRNNSPRPSIGGGVVLPTLPLDLRYLITPWAKRTVDSHQIVGYVLKTMYANASLTRGGLIGESWDSDDSVQFVLESLPVEQHYDIWEATEIPYRLSLSYLARVVGLDPDAGPPHPPVVKASFGGPA